MKFISKISKQGEDYFIRIPRDVRDKVGLEHKVRDFVYVVVKDTPVDSLD